MSVFGTTDSHIVYGGNFADGTVGGRSARQMGYQGRVDFAFTGTQLVVSLNQTGYTYSIDGGAPQTGSTSTSTWRSDTLATGLSDTTHQVWIQANDANMALDTASFATVTGAAPALAFATNFSANNYLIPNYSSYFAHDGALSINSQANQNCYNAVVNGQSYPDGRVRFWATCTGLSVFGQSISQKYRLIIDGIDQGVMATAPSPIQWNWFNLSTTLDGSKPHEYMIAGTATTLYLTNIMTLGGPANVTNVLPNRPCWGIYGDSIPLAFTGTGNDSGLGLIHRLALQMGVGCRNFGFGGSTVHNFGGGGATGAESGEGRAGDITGLGTPLSALFILYGTNDASQAGGAETAAQFQTSYNNMLTTLIGGLAVGTPIYCLTLLPSSNATLTTNRPSFMDAQRAAILQTATGRCPVYHIDTSGWLNTGSDSFDGTHPNSTGYDKILQRLISKLRRIQRSGTRRLHPRRSRRLNRAA